MVNGAYFLGHAASKMRHLSSLPPPLFCNLGWITNGLHITEYESILREKRRNDHSKAGTCEN